MVSETATRSHIVKHVSLRNSNSEVLEMLPMDTDPPLRYIQAFDSDKDSENDRRVRKKIQSWCIYNKTHQGYLCIEHKIINYGEISMVREYTIITMDIITPQLIMM